MTNPPDPQHPAHPPQPPLPPRPAQAPTPESYGAYAHPAPYGSAPTPPSGRSSNVPGVISFVTAALLALLTFVGMLVQASLFTSTQYESIQIASVVSGVISGLLAVVAVVFGIIGLVKHDRPKVLAGIGTGAGAFELFSVLTWSLFYPALIQAFAG